MAMKAAATAALSVAAVLAAGADDVAAAEAAAAQPAQTVIVTPWCDNSVRVRVQLANMPASTAAASAALARSLAAKNLTDLAGGLDDRPGAAVCVPGAPQVVAAGGPPLTNGNLRLTVDSAGSVQIARADSSTLLFTASAAFAENPDPSQVPTWTAAPDVDLQCTGSEYVDQIGTPASAAGCLAMVEVGSGFFSAVMFS
jgi:hypothetical protein